MDGGPKAEPGPSSVPHHTVQALARMIRELEAQLDRMFEINGSLERELEGERARRRELERKCDDLAEKLQRSEESALEREGLAAEASELGQERSRLVRTVEDQRRALAEHAATVERLRAGRADALDELHIVEAQFERAMELVNDLKARLAIVSEEHEALRGRMQLAEAKVVQAEQERDLLMAEVEESRAALEEIRRSLVDACVASQSRWKEGSPG
jgi:chromosome segregation ATPase